VHYPVPLDRQPALAQRMSGSAACPVSHRLAEHVVSLPMHPYLTEDAISQVAMAVRAAVAKSPPMR